MYNYKKNILCIDGGGARGIIPMKILDIIYYHDNNFLKNIDIISGSSIGAVIGCALIIPDEQIKSKPKYSIKELYDLFKKKIPIIFTQNWSHYIKTLGGLIGPKYSDYYILLELENIFSNLKIKDLLKPIIIPSYDLLTDKAIIFNTLEHGELYVKDLLRSVTAAPTYFSPNNIIINNKENTLVDSGVVLNNTSRLCLNFMIEQNLNSNYIESLNKCKNNIKILNIGTGKIKTQLINKKNNYGILGWTPSIINILMNAETNEDINECKKILDYNFLKFNCTIDIEYYDMDNSNYINYYIDKTIKYFNKKKIDKYFKWCNYIMVRNSH